MTQLNCGVGSCANNKSGCCCLSSIEVGGQSAQSSASTCCENFAQKSASFTNDAMTPELNLNIGCQAKNCMYNSNGSCCSDHVNISGFSASTNRETLCETFKAR